MRRRQDEYENEDEEQRHGGRGYREREYRDRERERGRDSERERDRDRDRDDRYYDSSSSYRRQEQRSPSPPPSHPGHIIATHSNNQTSSTAMTAVNTTILPFRKRKTAYDEANPEGSSSSDWSSSTEDGEAVSIKVETLPNESKKTEKEDNRIRRDSREMRRSEEGVRPTSTRYSRSISPHPSRRTALISSSREEQRYSRSHHSSRSNSGDSQCINRTRSESDDSRASRGGAPEPTRPLTRLLVEGLTRNVSEAHIREIFTVPLKSLIKETTPDTKCKDECNTTPIVDNNNNKMEEDSKVENNEALERILAIHMPMDPLLETCRGHARLEFSSETAAKTAYRFMHGGQLDGASIRCTLLQQSSSDK